MKKSEGDKPTDRQILKIHGNFCNRTSMQVIEETLPFTLTD